MFEQLQVIYYLSRGKDVFVVALHALSIMFAMICDHHLTTIAVICCCFDFTTDQMAKMAERGTPIVSNRTDPNYRAVIDKFILSNYNYNSICDFTAIF